MDKTQNENRPVSPSKPALDDNWNERKHLAETEFELRSEIQSLLQHGGAAETFQAARERERACRASLGKNNDEYDALMEAWAAEAFKVAP